MKYMNLKYIITIITYLLVVIQVAKSQNLTSELNNIALNNDMMGGAVVIFCENQILDSFYYGKSDYQRNIKADQHTKFRIASISKSITAIAAMQLVEQNLLDINANIGTILGYNVQNPNFPAAAITVKMLLSHTSSIVDGSTYSAFLNATVNNNPIPNLSELLTPSGSFYHIDQFNNKLPGTYFNYANVNYVILGTIVEKISNTRFDVYCRQHIFQPLGLDASFNVNDLQNINNVAVLYRKISGVWIPQADNFQGIQPVHTNLNGYIPGTNGGRFGPQGGLRISAQDLAKIFMCIFNPDFCTTPILTKQSVSAMIANHWTYNGSNGNNYGGLFLSWGLGIHRITSTPGNDIVLPGSNTMFGHTGEAYGLVSDAYYDSTRNVGLVFITNGVGIGYHTNSYSAFYTIEQEVFNSIENYGNLHNCLSLSIHPALSNNNSFIIYPNPSSHEIYIRLNNFSKQTYLKVYGIDGKLFMELNIVSPLSCFDISPLKSGIYIIKVDEKVARFAKY